jgi:transaldolase
MTLLFHKKATTTPTVTTKSLKSPQQSTKDDVNNKKKQPQRQEQPTRQSSSNTITTGNNQDSYLNGIGSYEFIKSLGNGKFSRVMLAYHLETHQQVAIKVPSAFIRVISQQFY